MKNPLPEPDSGKKRARKIIELIRNARFSFRISGRYVLSLENSSFIQVAFLSTQAYLRAFVYLLSI
jgi:hypothetical protein